MLLYQNAREKFSQATRLLQEMDRLHRASARLRPAPPMKRGDMALLGALLHFQAEGVKTVNASRLALATRQSLPAISQKLRALEGHGFIRRKQDKADRRVAYIQLTPKGKRAAEDNFEAMLGQMEDALGRLGSADTEQLITLMGRLSTVVEEMRQEDAANREAGCEACGRETDEGEENT